MAVLTQSYTDAAGGYTAAQLATALGNALIDTGIMTAWHDSGTSGGLEFRVLRVVYDAGRTYGTTFYTFLFSGADIFLLISAGWNSTSKIPAGVGGAGTIYLDWFSTTLSTANAMRLTASTSAGFNSLQAAPIKRWTSQDRPNFSVIQITNGTTNVPFFIERTAPSSTMVDLDKEIYTSMMWPRLRTSANTGTATFQLFPPVLRGSHLGASLRGHTTASIYGLSATATAPWSLPADDYLQGITYGAPGNQSGSGSNYSYSAPVIQLPVKFNNTNSRFTTDDRPPYNKLLFNNYSSATLPEDFAIIPVYTANTLSPGETITITAGSEVYTIISVVNASTVGNGPTMVFAARTT